MVFVQNVFTTCGGVVRSCVPNWSNNEKTTRILNQCRPTVGGINPYHKKHFALGKFQVVAASERKLNSPINIVRKPVKCLLLHK